MHVTDQLPHPRGQLLHLGSICDIKDRLARVAPGVKDQLGVTVIGDDPAKEFAGDQVADGAGFRLREGAWTYIGVIAGDVTRRADVEGAPHVPVIAIRIDAETAVRIRAAVLAPQ